ncbi:MAG: hypothetical protein R3D30_06110 [Hyphomicrobiales bacterium]
MPSKIGRNLGLALFSASALAYSSHASGAESGNSESIGPWQIEATYKADKFDRCAISREVDDEIVVTFVRDGDGLSLLLESPNWKLERGKQYPVTLKVGPQSFDKEVAAEASSVSMPIEDDKFTAGLSSANALDIVAAGATIHVPLDKSNVALDRLERCMEKNEQAVAANPFVAPARRP